MNTKVKLTASILVLIILAYVFLMLGNDMLGLTNPDEVFYAQTAKEMAQRGTWSVPFLFGHPQFEKPILTYWLLRVGFLFFDVTNFGARFFPALFAVIGLIAVYLLSFLGYRDTKKSLICSFILMSSALYVGLARTLFPDMIFSVFILLSLLSFFWGYTKQANKTAGVMLFFLFSGLAVLTKGPLGVLIPAAVVFLFIWFKRESGYFFDWSFIGGALVFIAVALPWYLFMYAKFDWIFIQEFFYNDYLRRLLEAEHKANDTWYFYPLSIAIGIFPWSVFMIASFFHALKRFFLKNLTSLQLFALIWFCVVFVIFEVSHSKLPSYILPLFPALAIMTGDFVCFALEYQKKQLVILSIISWFVFLSFFIVGVVSAARFTIYLPPPIVLFRFGFLYGTLLLLMAFFILKRKLLINFYMGSVQIIILLFFITLIHERFENYFCSQGSSDYLKKNYDVNNTIICSKPFVRGVRFFTGNEIALINLKDSNFFSPHPILSLDTGRKIQSFIKDQPVTYGVLTESSFSDLKKVSGDKFEVDLLQVFGNQHIVRMRLVK